MPVINVFKAVIFVFCVAFVFGGIVTQIVFILLAKQKLFIVLKLAVTVAKGNALSFTPILNETYSGLTKAISGNALIISAVVPDDEAINTFVNSASPFKLLHLFSIVPGA